MAAVAALLWSVVIWRTPTVRHAGTGRTLWCAMAALALAQSLQVLAFYQALDRTLDTPGAASAVKHTAALLAAACIRSLVGQLADERLGSVRRIGLPITAAALMVVPFLAWPPTSTPAGLAGHLEYYGPGIGVTLPWLAYLTYGGWALISAARLCWRHRQYAASPALRWGLTMVACGTTVGFVFIPLKASMQALWMFRDGSAFTQFDAVAEAVIVVLAITMCCLGATSEALADRAAHISSIARAVIALHRLRPLWMAVRGAAPSVVLLPDSGPLSALDPRTVRLRLVRRVVEIRDALMALDPYVPAHTRQAALVAAAALGLNGAHAAAAAEAGQLIVALRAHAHGLPPSDLPRPAPPGGTRFAEETAWLERVSAQLGRPHSQAIALLVTAAGGPHRDPGGHTDPEAAVSGVEAALMARQEQR